MHHIIGDGQSFKVITAEMSRLYDAFTAGQQSPLAELAVQYVDYAAWQRQWLQGEVLETRIAYWRKHLQDMPRRLGLPHQRLRPRVQGFKGARQDLNLSPELTNALRELSKSESVTLLMAMLSGLVLLLKHYTGDEDIVVGTVSANRDRSEAENLIGILANPLVLRMDVSGAPSFKETMQRVKEVCLDAYSYQVPPEILRERLDGRAEDGDRLFEAFFQLERREHEGIEMQGLECEWYTAAREEAKFEMSVMLTEHKNTIDGIMEYDADLFDDETMSEMLRSYVTLLEEATANPNLQF